MKQFLAGAAAFGVSYWLVRYGVPMLRAKFETMDLDEVWDLWDSEEWMK